MTDGYKIKRVLTWVNNQEKQIRPTVVPATAITLNKSSISLTTAGQTSQITATLTPADSTSTVSWTSSNTSIATVSSTGLVTCVTPGDCTITATTNNGLTATCGVSNGWVPGANTYLYLPMDSNFNDKTGNHTITNSGATITTVGGISCGYFNGHRLTCSGSPIGNPNYTISVRARLSGTGGGWIIGSNHSAVYSGDQLLASYSTSEFEYRWYRPYNEAKVRTSRMPSTNTWQHICYSNGKIYLNGVDISTSTGSGTMSVGYPYTIGQQNNGDNSYYGYMSKLIVETVGWTYQEVLDYYNQTKSNYGL